MSNRPIQRGDIIRLHDSAWKIDMVVGHSIFSGPLKWYAPDLKHIAGGVWITKDGGYNSSVKLADALVNGTGVRPNWKGEPVL